MTAAGDQASGNRSWTTSITRIQPDCIEIAGIPIGELIGRTTLPEATHLLFRGIFPEPRQTEEFTKAFLEGAALPLPAVTAIPGEEPGRTLARHLLGDEEFAKRPVREQRGGEYAMAAFCLGRTFRTIGSILGTLHAWKEAVPEEPFSHHLYRIFTGEPRVREREAALLEATAVACVDHGVTPPSTQACIIAASVRAPYEVALAQGLACITDVHGGACGRAAEFFARVLQKKGKTARESPPLLASMVAETLKRGERVPGFGHRLHTTDPRSDALRRTAERTGIAAAAMHASTLAPHVLSRLTGIALPINVDGTIGAIIADMGLRPVAATLLFILGRLAGLSAHYFEEAGTFPLMRRIDFDKAVYRGR